MIRRAEFSRCGNYRLSLEREWSEGKRLCMIMLNPSTADATKDDSTTRKMLRYAKANGFGSYEAVNLFTLMSPHPKDLYGTNHPIGYGADKAILEAVAKADMVIVAWGDHGIHRMRSRYVMSLLRNVRLLCIGTNKSGEPTFPSPYIKEPLTPRPYTTPRPKERVTNDESRQGRSQCNR